MPQRPVSTESVIPRFPLYFAGALGVALVILFHRFIFQNVMLDSFDIEGFGLAHRSILWEYVKAHGAVPLWNPYVLCGLPFVEAIHGGIFYPLSFIDYLGYTPRMIGFNFLVHFWLAGLFMYATARQMKLSQFGSALAGFAYAFSPLMLSWVAPGHDGKIYAATFFPLLVLFADRVFERHRLIDAALLGLVYAVIILTPHLQMAYYALFAIVAYAGYKSVLLSREKGSRREIVKKWSHLVAAIGLALLLSAVQWLPSYLYITDYSPRSSQEQGLGYASQYSLHLEEVISLGWPEFCGADDLRGDKGYWGRNAFRDNSEAVGSVTLFLAILALFLRGDRSRYGWGAMAVAVLLYAAGASTPIFGIIMSVIPLLESMRAPSTAMFIFAFCSALLAGMAVDSAGHMGKAQAPFSRRAVLVLGVVCGTALVFAVLFTVAGKSMLEGYASLLYSDVLLASPAATAKWSHAETNLPSLIAGLWRATIAIGVVSLAIVAIIRHKWRRQARIVILLCALAVNGITASRFIRVIGAHNVGDPKPVTQLLRSLAGVDRIQPLSMSMTDLQVGWYPLQTATGYHGKEPSWYAGLLGSNEAQNYRNHRFLNLTGTRYLVYPLDQGLDSLALGPRPLRPLAEYGPMLVVRNPNAFPRAFLVESVKVMTDLDAIHREVLEGETDLRQVAILEQPAMLPLTGTNDSSAASATISSYDNDRVVVSVSCRSNAVLILTDNYLPSWRAHVDGAERPIHRAYGAFRAIEIPAGSREVVFEYRSRSFVIGCILSLLGLGCLVGGVGYGQLWRRRQTSK